MVIWVLTHDAVVDFGTVPLQQMCYTCKTTITATHAKPQLLVSLVTSSRVPPGEKRSGERSQISWAYYLKAVRTNEIVRSVIIT